MVTWNLAEARKVATAKQHKGAVWSLSYSAGTGDLLASGDHFCPTPTVTHQSFDLGNGKFHLDSDRPGNVSGGRFHVGV